MAWLVYENVDESTQLFVGVLLISSIVLTLGVSVFFWVRDLIKEFKNKRK